MRCMHSVMSLTAWSAGLLFIVIRVPESRGGPTFQCSCWLLEGISLTEFHASWLLVVTWCSLCLLLNVLFDFFWHCDEGLLNVDGVLGGCLQERYFKVSCQFRPLIVSDLADLFHVTLISNENLAHTRVSKALDLVHPLTNILKWVSIRHVIHYNDAMCTSIVAAGECAESFLACGVPNLQLHNLFIEHNGLDFLSNDIIVKSDLQSLHQSCWKSSR